MGRIAQLSMIVLLGILAIGLGGCQTFNIRSDWDPTKPLDDFEKYHWLEPPEREGVNPFADNTLLRNRVRLAIETELEHRGFASVETLDAADFQVTYSVILDERIRIDGYSTGGAWGYRNRYSGFGSVYTSANVRNFQESTLIVDFLDPSNEDLVWRGWGTGIVRTRDRDRGQKRLEKGVKAVLAAFPPNSESD
jgi:hypothetical protein